MTTLKRTNPGVQGATATETRMQLELFKLQQIEARATGNYDILGE